jgi:hypothetical protein
VGLRPIAMLGGPHPRAPSFLTIRKWQRRDRIPARAKNSRHAESKDSEFGSDLCGALSLRVLPWKRVAKSIVDAQLQYIDLLLNADLARSPPTPYPRRLSSRNGLPTER